MPKKSSLPKHPEYNLGERLKFIRESRKLTQVQLSKMAKVSQAAIAHLERGTKDPSVDMLRKLAVALDVEIATLFAAEDVYVFDLKRLRRKYKKSQDLTPHLYKALSLVVQYAEDIGL
ncbi:MAG: helix-turn-helix domain-containing protein [Proteobacteria bacterium]|jgi:transcriptional regulator with XRE-family HTH domain|nr:helix-turn-helix domain-containing protein [Pseudomonadota bacterium]